MLLGLQRLALPVATLACTSPIIVATLRTINSGYVATGDIAATELRVRDVASFGVTLGPYSRFGWHHPGPLLFWIFTPLYTLTRSSSWSLPATVAIINVACVIAIVQLIRRRFGDSSAFASLVPIALLLHGLGPSILTSPWNPDVPVLPFLVLMFIAIEIADGRWSALPWYVLMTSFIVQSHIGAALPVAFVSAAAIASGLRAAHRGLRPQRVGRGLVIVTCAVTLWAWLGPIIEQLRHGSRGNLALLWQYSIANHSKVGANRALHAVTAAFATTATWWHGPPSVNPFSNEDLSLTHWRLPIGLILIAPVFVVVWRRHREMRTAIVVSIAALVGAPIGISQISGLGYGYLYRWLDPIAAASFIVALIGSVAIAARTQMPNNAITVTRAVTLLLLLTTTAASAHGAVAWDARDHAPMAIADHLSSDVEHHLHAGQRIEVGNAGGLKISVVTTAILLRLEKDGFDATAPPRDELVVGPHRITHDSRASLLVSDTKLVTTGLVLVAIADEITPRQRRDYETFAQRAAPLVAAHDIPGILRLGAPPKSGDQYFVYLLNTVG